MDPQPGHWKSLYSMIVTAAVSSPRTQSDSVTGAKMDSSVGPGVGSNDSTVQFARTTESLAGASYEDLVAAGSEISVGAVVSADDCVSVTFGLAATPSVGVELWQAVNTRVNRMNVIKISFFIVQCLSVTVCFQVNA